MEYLVFSVAIVATIFIIFIIGSFHQLREYKRYREKLKKTYGESSKRKFKNEELKSIKIFYEKNKEEFSIDDITWNDLNLDRVYENMNFCQSSAGDEFLYYMLRTPNKVYDIKKTKLEKLEQDIVYYMNNEEARIDLQLALFLLGRSGKYSIHQYIDNLGVLGVRKNTKYWIINSFYLVGIAILFLHSGIGILFLSILIAYNMLSYFKIKAEMDAYLTSFSYLLRVLKMAENVQSQLSLENTQEAVHIKECIGKFKKFRRGSFLINGNLGGVGSGNPLEVVLDYCRMIFYVDVMKFNQMLRELEVHLDDIYQLLEIIGYLDSVIAIGSYRKSLSEGYCVPSWSVPQGKIKGKQVYHPLLHQPVKNDIEVDKSILLTGSNASGKSTFLKAVALNLICAQTIHTCFAQNMEVNFCHIISSMSLKDNLEEGESYYIVEIKAIKRMLEMAQKSDITVVCFVDEVLRGTNTIERIAAATEILKAMNVENTLCFAATHDIELTELLKGDYVNYHFEEEFKEKDIFFSYLIKEGSAKTRNAIKLLEVMGYGEEIVKSAENLATGFMRNGVWKKK